MAGGHDSVKYSLIDDHDTTAGVPDRQSDTVRISRQTSSGPSTANMFMGRLRGTQRITFLAILLTAFVVIIWLLSHMDTSTALQSASTGYQDVSFAKSSFSSVVTPDGSSRASDLTFNPETEEAFKSCYAAEPGGMLGRSIPDVYKKLQLLKTSSVQKCRRVWDLFDNILRIEKVQAPIVLSEPFQIEVKGWLDNDDNLFQQVNHQVIYKVVNKGTYEETVINPIRSKRPQSKSSIDPLTYVKNLTDATRASCDFCQYKDHTAEDTFGRIDNEFSASCSNTFKLAKFHGLFFPKQHYPLNLNLSQLEDLFLRTSMQWFEKAYSTDKTQRFPSLLWDCLPHAGASQVHAHVHGILDGNQYAGRFESWHQVSIQYFNKLGRSYWSDFVKIHLALGLGISKGQAVVLTPLTSRKDHEFMILSPSLNQDVVGLIYSVLQTYQNRLGVYCFSSAGVYPKMGGDIGGQDMAGLPVIFRFGSRGSCSAVGSDVSSLELYTINNINSDLSKTFDGLMAEMIK